MLEWTSKIVFWRYCFMAGVNGKNSWALLLLILSGVVLGGFIGYLTRDVAFLSWLNYGQDFGIGSGDGNGMVRLNLGILVISFGMTIKITVAGILGVILAIIIYRKL
ncbi:hypothetical protein HNQ54_000029 [Anaerocolumna cellulosilytica]|nr:hypothetical protein [Anaerocolumna cellulosilytica]